MNTTYTSHVILFSPLPKSCSHAGRGGSSNAKVSVGWKACADMGASGNETRRK